MTDDRLPLAELMAKTGDGDFLRTVAESVLQIIMEADVDGLIGAGRHVRSGERSTWRNGYRDRSLVAPRARIRSGRVARRSRHRADRRSQCDA